MEETKEPMVPARGLSRRSFIKGAAATAALGTLAGCAPQTVGGDEEDAPLADTSVEIPETQHFAASAVRLRGPLLFGRARARRSGGAHHCRRDG